MHYDDIPFWINKKRTSYLTEFKLHIIAYFENITASEWGFIGENDASKKKRKIINEELNQAKAYINSTGISTTYDILPDPNATLAGHIDLFQHIFELKANNINDKYLIDIIERAIGIYKGDLFKSYIRTFNPFHWFFVMIDEIVKLPFAILGKVGFNPNKIEHSVTGKIIKTFEYVIVVISGVLTILSLLGYNTRLVQFGSISR